MNDTSRLKPHGYITSFLNDKMSETMSNKSFEGYKYALQFIWFNLLKKDFNSSSLVNLHECVDWVNKKEVEFSDIGEPIVLEDSEDNSGLDSYFVFLVPAPLFASTLGDLFEHAWTKFEHAQKKIPEILRAKT